jgi:hypothetical protein
MDDTSLLEEIEPSPAAIAWMMSLHAVTGAQDQALELATMLIDIRSGMDSDELRDKYEIID